MYVQGLKCMLSGSSHDGSRTRDEMRDGFVWQRPGKKVQRDSDFSLSFSITSSYHSSVP